MTQKTGSRQYRVRSGAISALVAVSLTGLAVLIPSSPAVAQENEDFVVTIAESIDLVAWNPYANSNTAGFSTWGMVYDPLVQFDFETGEWKGVLATSWKMEGTIWTFHLREGVTFHDGTPFTSADVVHSIGRVMNDPATRQAELLHPVVDVVAIDDLTVQFKTDVPVSNLLSMVMVKSISSVATYEALGAEEADRQPNGTGPYTFESWQRGSQIVLERWDGYWGELPEPTTIVISVIPDSAARLAALERGEVDIIRNLPIQDIARVEASEDIRLESIPGLRTLLLPINQVFGPFQDARVREAMVLAIDIPTIAETVFEGQITTMTGAVPEGIVGYDQEGTMHPYNPERSRELLAEAGYGDGLTIQFVTPTNRYPKDRELAQVIAQYLRQVGIAVNLETPEWGTFSSDMNLNRYPFFQISRGFYLEGWEMLVQYFQTGVSLRNTFNNPEFDNLMVELAGEVNSKVRQDIQVEAGQIVYDGFGAIFMGTYNDLYGVSNRIEWKPDRSENIYPVEIRRVDN